MREKELFERALGADEPPVRLDFEDIEDRGMKSVRRRRAVVPVVTAALTAVALSGGAFFLSTSEGGRSGQVQVAGPSTNSADSSSQRNSGEQRAAAPGNRSAAYCYKTADIRTAEADQHVLIGVSGDDPDGRGDVASRIMNICRQAWEQNYYGWHPDAGGTAFPVPQLVACVLDDSAVDAQEGAAAIFPGTPRTCADLGLPLASL